jgi:hypothetical protein
MMQLLAAAVAAATAGAPAAGTVEQLPVSFAGPRGPAFLGIGGVDAGTGARLLFDYPPAQRAAILDLLFLPKAGAALQVLKVEIGGDTQSTEGTEPSHMITREDGSLDDPAAYNRGWEWWLLEEAKKRNPNIVTMALSWGTPGWIGHEDSKYWPADKDGFIGDPAFYSEDDIDFHVRWVRGLKKWHNISLDYMGIFNERPILQIDGVIDELAWVVRLRAALDAEPDGVGKGVRLVADDTVAWAGTEGWVGTANCSSAKGSCSCKDFMNETLRDSIAGLSNHYSAESNTPPADCEMMRSRYGKELWVTEGAVDNGYGPTKAFSHGNVTGYLMWPLVPSFYPMLPFGGTGNGGVVSAYEPWSGSYLFSSTLAVTAHTTQFTAVRGACTYVPNSAVGVFRNGYVDAAHSIIATAFDCYALGWTVVISPLRGVHNLSTRLSVKPTGFKATHSSMALPTAKLWGSCGLTGSNSSRWMQQQSLEVRTAEAGAAVEYSFSVDVDCIYTLTTLQRGGGLNHAALAAVPPSAPLGLPLIDSFDDPARRNGMPGKFFQSMSGTWSLQDGQLEQVVPRRPIEWQKNMEPSAVVGDQRVNQSDGELMSSWVDYSVSASGRVDSATDPLDVGALQYLRVCGRINHFEANAFPLFGYCFTVLSNARCVLSEPGRVPY